MQSSPIWMLLSGLFGGLAIALLLILWKITKWFSTALSSRNDHILSLIAQNERLQNCLLAADLPAFSTLQMMNSQQTSNFEFPDPIPQDDTSEYLRWAAQHGLGDVISERDYYDAVGDGIIEPT